MRHRFFTLDVFTKSIFAGNPLAVVLDCEGLSVEAMQAIAREFNLSETVFVLPANNQRTAEAHRFHRSFRGLIAACTAAETSRYGKQRPHLDNRQRPAKLQ